MTQSHVLPHTIRRQLDPFLHRWVTIEDKFDQLVRGLVRQIQIRHCHVTAVFREAEILCDVSGGIPATFPYEGDFKNPETRDLLYKYITRNTPGTDFNLITYREYVGVSTTLLLFVAVTAPDISIIVLSAVVVPCATMRSSRARSTPTLWRGPAPSRR